MILDLIHQRNNMKIKRFNESEAYDLSFDGFKEVMSELTDELQCEYDFHEYNTDKKIEDVSYFELSITLRRPEMQFEAINLSYDFLDERNGGIPFIEDPQIVKNADIRFYIEKIKMQNESILNIESKIKNQVEKNNEVKNILIKVIKLESRLKSFDNFIRYTIGFDTDNNNLSIFFEF